MKRAIGWLGSLVLICAITLGAPSTHSIKWEKNYDQAIKLASASGKIVMIDFYTEWCGACRMLDQTTYKDKSVAEASQNLICLKVNAEVESALAQKYEVEAFPTIAFVDSSGTEILRAEGYREPAEFVDLMQQAQKSEQDFREQQVRVKQKPDDAEVNYLLARSYYERKKLKEGQEYMQKALTLDPDNKLGHAPELYMRAGLAHGMSRDFKRAIELLSLGVEKFPLSPWSDETGFYLALSYEFDHQIDRAKQVFARLVKSAKSGKIQRSAQSRLNELDGKG